MSWKKTWKAKNNMARAIVTAFHKYQPYGEIFYEPILDFFLQTMKKYQDEYDHVYLVDSNWNISPDKLTDKMTILRVNPHLRYYDAYNMDTRFRDRLTLAPAVQDAFTATDSNIYSLAHTTGEWPLLASGSQQKYSMSFSVAGSGSYATKKISLRLKPAATSGTVTLRVDTE